LEADPALLVATALTIKRRTTQIVALPEISESLDTEANIAVTVASMTESELGVASEMALQHALGEPGQHHEAGKAFGCSV
jgi:hypothetical protein